MLDMVRNLTEGSMAPGFVLPDQTGTIHSLKQYLGQWVVLYFYPKDDTPGCTVEACQFRDNFPKFKRSQAVVLGVSVDAVKKHAKFATKYELSFTLLSDEEKKVVALYGVWAKKKFMGREYMGILRTSFLIAPDGKITKVYEDVKPDGHAEEVLKDIKELSMA
jgi:thioredoxin-dependent peroxiredoxin